MKVKSRKSGRIFSDRFAATALKIGIGQEVGNSANLKPKVSKLKEVKEKIKVEKPKVNKPK